MDDFLILIALATTEMGLWIVDIGWRWEVELLCPTSRIMVNQRRN